MYDVELAATNADREGLRCLFRAVAREQVWQPGLWLEVEQPGAVYITLKVDGVLAGGLQMVLPIEAAALPFKNVWPEVELKCPGRTGHITVLAFLPEYRGMPTHFWALSIEVWRMCQKSGIDAVVLEATPAMLGKYRKLGWPIEEIGGLKVHWGEPCVLGSIEFDAVAVAMLKQSLRSPTYRSIVVQAIRSGRDIPCLRLASLA